jgi:hypothetical protein
MFVVFIYSFRDNETNFLPCVQYGASDIECLKFETLLLDTSTTKLKHVKMRKELTLQLLTGVGNAIIDF